MLPSIKFTNLDYPRLTSNTHDICGLNFNYNFHFEKAVVTIVMQIYEKQGILNCVSSSLETHRAVTSCGPDSQKSITRKKGTRWSVSEKWSILRPRVVWWDEKRYNIRASSMSFESHRVAQPSFNHIEHGARATTCCTSYRNHACTVTFIMSDYIQFELFLVIL